MNAKTREEIEKKAGQYEAAKNKLKEEIEENIELIIKKVRKVEKELLNEVEVEFGENPFDEFLSGDNRTEDGAKEILKLEVPHAFGPDEESFESLRKEIDSLKEWRKKPKPEQLIPKNVSVKDVTWNSISISWDAVEGASFYQIEVDESKFWDASSTNTFTKRGLLPDTEHIFRVRTVYENFLSEWSDGVKGRTRKKWECVWKKCPDDVYKDRKYSVDEKNPRIATKIGGGDDYWCTIIGNASLPLNKVTSWSINILKSKEYDGGGIFIGVAQTNINQNEGHNSDKCGWYFGCYCSALFSGPPHNYRGKEYGPRKGWGKYVHTGDSVGVVMDTTKGELSFVLDEVNYGVAYEGIPLDKPLVSSILLKYEGDSVELGLAEVKENLDSSIPVPFNITSKSITWDLITLTWDAVEGASFYQIEVDGSKSWETSTTNSFIKRGLLPETEHTFRVRVVRANSVSEWSNVVRGRAQKESFEYGWWKECPDNVYGNRKYSVDKKNPRIATKIGDGYDNCTIIGNTPLPRNKVISWSIKILKSCFSNGFYIYIGVAPFDIDQNEKWRYEKCGWYFECSNSTLHSGPPHNYRYPGKEYGPRKGREKYVHTGDSIGVVMDTTNGNLSFVLAGVNLGVAYEGIPLDKPLVPCVILTFKDDSVELDTSEVKWNDNSPDTSSMKEDYNCIIS